MSEAPGLDNEEMAPDGGVAVDPFLEEDVRSEEAPAADDGAATSLDPEAIWAEARTNIGHISDTVFNQTEILEYRFTMSADDLERLEEHGDEKVYLPAALTVSGGDILETFDQVGIRHKGSWSLYPCFKRGVRTYEGKCAKLSYKVKFHHYDGEARFSGLKRINLHAMAHDPSKLRERLAYNMFNAFGVEAPRAAYAKAFVNGELIGLFVQVEQVDGRFTAHHFPEDPDGNLYKEVWPQPDLDDAYYLRGLRTNNNPEDDPDVSDMDAFGKAVERTTEEDFEAVMAKWVDLEKILRYMAVDRAAKNWDGIVTFYQPQSPHNFYWYHGGEPGGIFHLIPWDLDNTFWEFDPFMHPEDWVTAEPVPDWNVLPASCDPVSLWVADNTTKATPPGCDRFINLVAATGWDRFVTLGKALLDGPLNQEVMTAKVALWAAEIDEAVAEDPSIDRGLWRVDLETFNTILEEAVRDFRHHLTEGYIVEETEEAPDQGFPVL
jgi:hypothetical protein